MTRVEEVSRSGMYQSSVLTKPDADAQAEGRYLELRAAILHLWIENKSTSWRP